MVIIWIITAAVMFGLYNVFIKVSADDINPILGAVVLQFVAAFMGLGMLLVTQMQAGSLPFWSGRGLVLASLAGVAIGAVEILTFFIYGRGVLVAVGNPLILGGSRVVTLGVGVFLLHESISLTQLMAVSLIFIGVLLLAWSAGGQIAATGRSRCCGAFLIAGGACLINAGSSVIGGSKRVPGQDLRCPIIIGASAASGRNRQDRELPACSCAQHLPSTTETLYYERRRSE